MIIGIEAERANNPVKTGVEHYAKQLILHLAEIDSVNQYILYLRSQPEEWFLKLPKNFRVKVMPFPIFWTQLRLSLEMLLHPVDVLFIPASALPIIHPKKSVVTIHDVAWLFYPGTFTWFNRTFLKWSSKFALDKAWRIISVSESTKKDLVKHYGVSGDKVKVVRHGYELGNFQFFTLRVTTRRVAIFNFQLPEKYVLFLSTIQPRKNLEGLIDAFVELKQECPELEHKLVVVGRPGWKFESALKKIEEHKDCVVYLNHVSDNDRLEIMRRASLLALPSFYEGFGMQILEAFDAGIPVVTSNISSMPEVAGDAAVYFDPHDSKQIKNALKAVLFDKSLSERLVQKGKERLKEFSWNKCARETLEVLLK